MSSGPNRLTEAYKARKRIRDARYRVRMRARNRAAAMRLDAFIASYSDAFVNRGSV